MEVECDAGDCDSGAALDATSSTGKARLAEDVDVAHAEGEADVVEYGEEAAGGLGGMSPDASVK